MGLNQSSFGKAEHSHLSQVIAKKPGGHIGYQSHQQSYFCSLRLLGWDLIDWRGILPPANTQRALIAQDETQNVSL